MPRPPVGDSTRPPVPPPLPSRIGRQVVWLDRDCLLGVFDRVLVARVVVLAATILTDQRVLGGTRHHLGLEHWSIRPALTLRICTPARRPIRVLTCAAQSRGLGPAGSYSRPREPYAHA